MANQRAKYKPVDSSWIDGIKTQTNRRGQTVVRMRTNTGKVYDYHGGVRKFKNWCKAGSKGKYFNELVRDKLITRVY